MGIKFGTAGNSSSFYASGHKKSAEAPSWLEKIGLDAYEYQCGKGITVGEKAALEIGAAAKEHGIAMSLHAPYFANIANPDETMREKTIRHIVSSCKTAGFLGAGRVVVHSGSLLKNTREAALEIAKTNLKAALDACDNEGYSSVAVCPELMGGISQLGTLDEVCELCKIDDRLIPCIDFGHYNARHRGILKDEADYLFITEKIQNSLGYERLRYMHCHFSKIEYSKKRGEIRHLTFEDKVFGPEFAPLAQVIKKNRLEPVIICESDGTQAEDALTMRKIYEEA